MSNGVKPVAQTYYEISDVKYTTVNKGLDYDLVILSWYPNSLSHRNKELICFRDFQNRLNNYKKKEATDKIGQSGILKGLYGNYFSGEYCQKGAPYLCFDIDVEDSDKKKENTHLLDHDTNQLIFDELQKIAVICWRSNSGSGIAGVLYVPQLANYLNDDKDLHLNAGKVITNHLSEYLHDITGIERIVFDKAQSVFRQIRLVAEQGQPRTLNPNPFEFTYIAKKIKELTPGVTAYKTATHQNPYGTISGQFDNDNDILPFMLNNGFSIVSDNNGKVRVKHIDSESSTTGSVDTNQNVYFNYSGSLGGKTSFTPSKILYTFQCKGNGSDFYKYLRGLGYEEKQRTNDEVKDVSKALKHELQSIQDDHEAEPIIFKYCYDLKTLTAEQKQKFIKDNCTRPELKKYFVAYLNLNDYKIVFDKELRIKKYVDEVLPETLNYADQHGKVILRAETGKGKTTAIFSIHKHRPQASILVLEPLTIILDQNKKEYEDKAVFLDGTSPKSEFERAEHDNLVFATYDQGAKILHYTKFDYIIIDEIHQTLTANGFKRGVIANLTPYLNNAVIIGLTGTPTTIFKKLGYQLLNVDVSRPQKTKVEARFLNNKPYNIALSHIMGAEGKTLIRLNDTEGLKALKKQFVATGRYKADEVLILYSDKQIKTSKDFKQLAHQRRFDDKIKLVLTTSLIDEGLSIDQTGFTDIVFIETSYHPRPEAIKQFFARFRNEDPNRKNYLYLRTTEDQTPSRFNQLWAYSDTLTALQNEAEQMGGEDVISSYNAIFSNDDYYYEDNTVNPFYLAYSVTESLFKSFNTVQFLTYLETNYNLDFNKNPDFEIRTGHGSLEVHHRKEVKQKIAMAWDLHKDEVLQTLYYSTLSSSIRSDLTVKQMFVDDSIKLFVIDNIKAFEKLYRQSKELVRFGVDDPDSILLEERINEGAKTLVSTKKYKDEVTLLKLNKMIFEPETEADHKAKNRVIKFTAWCEGKEEFTHNQMFRELKKLGVYKNSDFSFPLIVRVLDWFGLEAKRDTNSDLINTVRNNKVDNITL